MKRIAGVAAALLVASLSACSGLTSAPEPTTTPTSTPKSDRTVDTARTSTSGLDVRYLDDDGSVKTVKVRTFPR